MIKAVGLSDRNISFNAKPEKKKDGEGGESVILPNTLKTRVLQKYDKTMSAVTEYPVKGLRGDVNSDFYEFLSMGIIPYLVGSAMFMGCFNFANKHLLPAEKKMSTTTGGKMALGVVLYGLLKTLSGDLVTRPVAWSTGVDIETPYRNVFSPLPKEPGEVVYPMHQQRKVYDSIEFFRKDLISKDPKYGKAYYDNIAKKIGLGDNLNDSVTETTPIIQSIVATTKTAKTLSTYSFAALGIGLAVQDDWKNFFHTISNRRRHIAKPNEGFFEKMGHKLSNMGKNSVDISKSFVKNFGKSFKSLWNGEAGRTGFMKHAGKAWILLTAAITAGTTFNAIHKAKSMGKLANKDIIDKNQESTVI